MSFADASRGGGESGGGNYGGYNGSSSSRGRPVFEPPMTQSGRDDGYGRNGMQDGPLIGGMGGNDQSQHQYGEREEYERVKGLVVEDIKQLSYRVTQIEKLLQLVDTSRDTQSMRSELQQSVDSTRALAKDANANLKLLASFCNRASSTAEVNSRKRNYDEIRQEFVVWLGKFQEATRRAEQKHRAPSSGYPRVESLKLTESDSDERTGLLDHAARQQREQRQKQLNNRQVHIDMNQALIEEREIGIREIHQGVLEIADIMNDLDIIVKEQGELVGTIESNITHAADDVHEGVEQIKDAHKKQKGMRCTRCFIIIAILCFVAIAITAIALGVSLS